MLVMLIATALAAMLLGIPFTSATLIYEPTQFDNLLAQALGNINDPLLIGIPILVIAGEMLSSVGVIDPIVDFADRILGRYPGSLGLTCVGTSMFFAGSTGSSAAEAAAVAAAFRRPMATRGYPSSYVAPLVASSTAVGVLFPPSLAMILYATIIEYPVTKLWAAGLYPGILTGIGIAVVAVVLGRREFKRRPDIAKASGAAARGERTRRLGKVREIVAAVGGLLLPVFVIGGIYSGVMTLTEVAAVLVALVILYGLFLTRVGAGELLKSARRGAERAGAVFIIIVAARLFSTVLTEQQVLPRMINYVHGLGLSKDLLLLMVNVALILAGIFMDALSLIIIGAPILYQLLSPEGVSPVHLAIIMAMNIEIGVVHPPFGGNLFAVSAVTGVSVGWEYCRTWLYCC
jgi:C4-dicarboxylate transporter DctM subunit